MNRAVGAGTYNGFLRLHILGTRVDNCVLMIRPRAELEFETILYFPRAMLLGSWRAVQSIYTRIFPRNCCLPNLCLLSMFVLIFNSYIDYRLPFLARDVQSRQACYDAARAMDAHGAGVQLQRRDCVTHACRAVWPGAELLDADLQRAFL